MIRMASEAEYIEDDSPGELSQSSLRSAEDRKKMTLKIVWWREVKKRRAV